MTDSNIELKSCVQRLRRLEQQVLPFIDDSTNEVRKSAIGVRDVVASLQDNDVRGLIKPTKASRR